MTVLSFPTKAERDAAVEAVFSAWMQDLHEAFGHEAIRRKQRELGARIVEALNSGDIEALPLHARDLIWELPQDADEALRRVRIMISLEEAAWRRLDAGAFYVKVSRRKLDALHAMAFALQARPLAWARTSEMADAQ